MGSKGQRYILVMYDLFSHFLIAVPMNTRNSQDMGDAIYRHLFLPHGAPARLIADNEFNNQ